MPWRAEGVFPLFHIGKKRAGKGRRNVIEVFTRVLLNAGRDIFRHAERIFKEPQRHPHIMRADVHGRVGIDKGIQREIFVQLVDLAAQLQIVFVPVEDHATDSRVMLNKLQQVGAVVRPDELIPARLKGLLQLLDGLVFIKDAVRPHNGNDVHGLPP